MKTQNVELNSLLPESVIVININTRLTVAEISLLELLDVDTNKCTISPQDCDDSHLGSDLSAQILFQFLRKQKQFNIFKESWFNLVQTHPLNITTKINMDKILGSFELLQYGKF